MTDVCEITLEQLLKARDERAEKQKELIKKFGMPLISLTVNIPGRIKKTSASSNIFKEGCNALIKKLEENKNRPQYFEMCELITGPEAYAVVNSDEYELKEFVLQIENRHPLGRLLDFDVIGCSGNIISREELGYPKRKCLLCDEDAHVCARSRAHPLELLLERIQSIADSYFSGRSIECCMVELCEAVGRCAVTSMLYEVSAVPKPGLVDRLNQGAHQDMDFFSFMASTAALSSYFIKCAFQGAKFHGDNPWELFESLRPIGIEAENAMLRSTGGVNTHKGLIFSMGIISAAAAWCIKEKKDHSPDAEEICEKVSQMTRGLCSKELYSMEKTERFTHGESQYKKHGFRGIRGEVENGFPTVRAHSLPVLTQLKSMKLYHINDILVQTLLHLMAVNEDTNIGARHDMETLSYVRKYASEALNAGGMFTSEGVNIVREMDRDFIKKNISPGGSADLLAITIMFDLLNEL